MLACLLSYSEANFEVFRPAGVTRCTDGGEIWHGGHLLRAKFQLQLQTIPYPTASTSFLYSNAFMAKSGTQSLTFKSVMNKQTDKQTEKKLNVFGQPGGGRNSSPTKLRMVIEDLEHILAPPNFSGYDTYIRR